jgi:hypothetical protein
LGSYTAYTSPWFPVVGQAGDTNSIRYSYPAGTFSTTGNILLTFEVDGDGVFNVEKQAPGVIELITAANFVLNGNISGVVNVNAVGGILNTNFMAVENGARFAISGVNTSGGTVLVSEYGPVQYNTTFGTSSSPFVPGGAFYYDNGTSKTRPTIKSANNAITWNTASNSGTGYMVVDFGQQRVINTVFAHQTNADGRFTSMEIAVANSPLPGNDPGWTVIKPFVANEISCSFSTAGTQINFPITVTRYIRYRFQNSGACGFGTWIEVFGIGTFLHF